MLPRATRPALVAVSICCLFFVACKSAPVTTTANGDVGLNVRPSGHGLAVTWNRSNPALGRGIGGALVIEDGAETRTIDLSADQLRAGSVNYLPQTHTVRFHLEIYRDEQHFDGEDLTVSTGVPKPVPQQSPQPAVSQSAQRLAPRHLLVIPRSKTSVTLVLPPPSIVAPYVAAHPNVAIPSLPPAPAPSLPPPSKLIELPPPAASMNVRPPTISYVGPAPIRKIAPAVPDNLRFLIQDGVSVGVKVEIDAKGKVTGATPVETSNAVQKLLGPTAAQAALLWKFEPARRDGRVVASETVLEFDFERGTR